MFDWTFTLIHKLSISKLINCKIVHQWNKSVRQYYLSHWSPWAGETTEPWQTDWEQRGLDTDVPAHMKLAATLLSTSTVTLVSCAKDHGSRPLLRRQNPSFKHGNILFLCYYMGSSSQWTAEKASEEETGVSLEVTSLPDWGVSKFCRKKVQWLLSVGICALCASPSNLNKAQGNPAVC